MSYSLRSLLWMACFAGLSLGACGEDDDDSGDGTPAGTGSPEQTGSVCEGPEQCYPDVADGELLGDALCLTRVRGGYCTHTCTADDECCAAPGECETDLEQVCSPFESTGQMMCFLSCEADAIPDARDEQEYCQQEASRDFICRSSGGGSTNRKVCVPGDCGVGAACGSDADCDSDLSCALSIRGGYCTVACSVTSDCPTGSRCAALGDDESRCYRECTAESDCSFCRGDELRGSCTSDVNFADSDDSVAVCAPPS